MELVVIYYRFFNRIGAIDIVHINPSLNRKCFFREGFFLIISRLRNKKTLVYWHGWNDCFESKICRSRFLKFVFNLTFAAADLHIVLGRIFREKLNSLGVKNENIKIESNTADDSYIQNGQNLVRRSIRNILFLARIEIEKGVFIAIDAFQKLNENRTTDLRLVVAGEGSELLNAKEYVSVNGIANIDFIGHIADLVKHKTLCDADVLLLPTFHEGMPLVIIESMLYGLPILSSPVGGIPDWVEEGENGFLINSKNPDDYANTLRFLIDNPNIVENISSHNRHKAVHCFIPQIVSERIFSYYYIIKNK
jgi:glycosyltransferase involved in cell wall biosynthesis